MPSPQDDTIEPVLAADDEAEPTGEEHDPYYPPVIVLPEVLVNSGEEEEEVFFRMRAKLYRYDSTADPPEWKERGTGDVKILEHKELETYRVVMRRDKTLKICANHLIQSWMVLKVNCGSDRAFVWSVQADFADEEAKHELLAIRFANAENAQKFRLKFEQAVKLVTRLDAQRLEAKENEDDADLVKKVEKVDLNVEKENLSAEKENLKAN
eukprot:maker-scaffold1443_size41101-snap-gene-0.8 protein:Tk06076 transcript:maker-scaffold1443_size41101-snap-gene-0.8-mRNA-1 annotation:"ran-specific gtpase-activating"